jgi:hypothetical protein
MPSRKVYVDATVRVIVVMEEGVDLDDVLSTLTVTTGTEGAYVEDFEIIQHDIMDSK